MVENPRHKLAGFLPLSLPLCYNFDDEQAFMKQIHINSLDDQRAWEEFVVKHAPHSFFQAFAWGAVIARSSTLYRLGIHASDKLVGIAQTAVIRARRGTFLHIRHGPVLAEWSKPVVQALFAYIITLARQHKAVFIRISPLIQDTLVHRQLLASLGFRPAPIHAMDSELCWVLDIEKTDEQLLAGMRKNTRNLIRRAQREQIAIVQSFELDQFLHLYTQTAKRQKFVPHRHIADEFAVLGRSGDEILLLGYVGNTVTTGALIAFYHHQAIYRHSATIPTKAPVSHLLQWKAIQIAKKRGCTRYNLWGIAPDDAPRHPWRGLTLFKKGFGGHAIDYIHAHDLPLSARYWVTFAVETIRKVKKGY